MNATQFVTWLSEAIQIGEASEIDPDVVITGVRDFQEIGLLTSDQGIEVRLASGDRFQLTVVQSR